jgi:hypothetical protein
MKQTHSEDQEVFEIIMRYLDDQQPAQGPSPNEGSKVVNFERLNILIDAFQFYPLIIKRDKNLSSSIH